MPRRIRFLVLILAGAAAWSPSSVAQPNTLVPLDDAMATEPLLPAGLSRAQPELFGKYVHVWKLESGESVIQYYGDFELHLGARRLLSRDAVVWMQPAEWQGTSYYHYEAFLSHDAVVKESAGSVTTGPMLFVTFNSLQFPSLAEDVYTEESAEHTPLYQEAAKIRQGVLAGGAAVEPKDWQVVDVADGIKVPQPKAPALIRHTADDEMIDQRRGVITAIGQVYVSQGLNESQTYLEIRADQAVLFLVKPKEDNAATQPAASAPAAPEAGQEEPFPTETPPEAGPGGDQLGMGESLDSAIAGAYLSGDVVLTRGDRMIRATELYYDFENDRALILDAVMRAPVPDRGVSIYVRADQIRQLSSTEYMARNARVSTSEFHTPHVHIGAERIYLTDDTARDASGDIIGLQAGRYQLYDTTLNVEGVPIAYWPYAAGDFRQSESAFHSVRTGYSRTFGAAFQTKWYLFNLLGLETPQGVNALLRLDYLSKRGPGVGIDSEYELENSYGLLRSYYIYDTGDDRLGSYRDGPPDTENRGRLTFRHREFLPQGWELTLEGSYLSDPTFLQQYFPNEFYNDKQQETLAYLKKQKDNWAFTALAQWRVIDFLTQTEHLPDVGFNWIGEPLGELASYFQDSRVGLVRYRPNEQRLFDTRNLPGIPGRSDVTLRADSRHELDLPIKLGFANVVPYAMARGGYWDGSPDPDAGSIGRMFGSLGVRTGTQFWRMFEQLSSALLDINGVRHIIEPQANAFLSGSNYASSDLYPFDDGVESIDDFYGATMALRQRWQTRRGTPGQWQTVDLLRFDVELNLFGNAPDYELPIGRFYDNRPENSIARNHVRTDFEYRISDTSALLSESNFDLNDGDLDLFGVTYAIEHTPRYGMYFGYRRIHDTGSDILLAGGNYQVSSRYSVGTVAIYDLQRSTIEQFDIVFVRKFPRFYAGLSFGLDNIEDDVSIGLTVWPEGSPQTVLGSRSALRYTGLQRATSLGKEE